MDRRGKSPVQTKREAILAVLKSLAELGNGVHKLGELYQKCLIDRRTIRRAIMDLSAEGLVKTRFWDKASIRNPAIQVMGDPSKLIDNLSAFDSLDRDFHGPKASRGKDSIGYVGQSRDELAIAAEEAYFFPDPTSFYSSSEGEVKLLENPHSVRGLLAYLSFGKHLVPKVVEAERIVEELQKIAGPELTDQIIVLANTRTSLYHAGLQRHLSMEEWIERKRLPHEVIALAKKLKVCLTHFPRFTTPELGYVSVLLPNNDISSSSLDDLLRKARPAIENLRKEGLGFGLYQLV